MKKLFYITAIILCLITGVCVYNVCFVKAELELVSEQRGGIKDFYIKDGKVYIIGGVTVKNHTDKEITYSLNASSEFDYKNGLLKTPILIGYDESLKTTSFRIDGKTTETFDVILVGEHAGGNQKYDRLMPEIEICY